ncbi:hypothetical protein NDU88_001659 [Pleurodeles waltl]|uniref:Uncharacterized protein n=1 Tax=Pleurodeles waltl TaxID=8319 RepID=A0AAV7UB17_PLEWA|nr:hypothetical protein NDU88_001659 [Pleurodeles waltl]
MPGTSGRAIGKGGPEEGKETDLDYAEEVEELEEGEVGETGVAQGKKEEEWRWWAGDVRSQERPQGVNTVKKIGVLQEVARSPVVNILQAWYEESQKSVTGRMTLVQALTIRPGKKNDVKEKVKKISFCK